MKRLAARRYMPSTLSHLMACLGIANTVTRTHTTRKDNNYRFRATSNSLPCPRETGNVLEHAGSALQGGSPPVMGSAKCWKTTHPILLALLLMLNCQHNTVAAAKLASFTQHASANSDAASPIASSAASSAAGPIPFDATSTLQAGSPSSGMAAGPVPSFADVAPAPRQPTFGYGPASGPTESDFLQSIPGSGLLPGQGGFLSLLQSAQPRLLSTHTSFHL